MQKLKIILLFKILIILSCIITAHRVFNYSKNYKLLNSNSSDIGTVTDIRKYDNYSIIIIKGKVKYRGYLKENNKLKIGDIISFEYTIKDLNTFKIPNTFNYYNYLKSVNIKGLIDITNYRVKGKNKLYSIKNKLTFKTNSLLSKKYIYTFIFSDKSYIDSDIKSYYINNGIQHHLCISGFHIVFLLTFIKRVLNKFTKNVKLVTLILISISFLYLVNTSFQISLLRACLLYFLIYFNKYLNININKRYIFILVLCISLYLYPGAIYSTSFWYSFIISFFLMFYGNKYNSIFKINIFAFIISMPLTIYFNYQINLLGIILSFIFFYYICYLIYPLIFLSLMSRVFDKLLYFLCFVLESINKYINRFKVCIFIFPKMSLWVLIIIYILYIIYLNKPLLRYIFLYLIVLIYSYIYIYFDSASYVYFVDVHQGDMILYVSKHHKNITIIDTGGIEYDSYLKNNIKTFLHSLGIKKINNIILTHGDFDHIGEAINLVNNFKVEKVIFNCGPYNDLEKELIKVLDKKRIKYYSCIKELNIDKNKLYFLQTKEYDNENDNSNVIYIGINGRKFMLMGDASIATEKEIMNKYNLQDIDVLKVGHHGSRTSSGKDFINKINSKYSIISVGKKNRYGHPNKEVLNNLNNSKIYRTDEDGSIILKIKNNKLKIKTCIP